MSTNWETIYNEALLRGFNYDEIYETDLEGLNDLDQAYDDAGMSPEDFA